MEERADILVRNVKEFYREGCLSMGRGSFNSAASLFFKALAVLTDWYILTKEGFIPKSHTERFRILQLKYSEIYRIFDKDFPTYQQSYTITISKQLAEVLKDDFENIAKKVGFKLD